MIKRLLNNSILNSKPTESVVAAAFMISVAGIASRLLGLFRDRILASQFGAGDALDVYYAAFRIPDLVYNLLVLGALSSAFIPVFTGLFVNKKEDESWELASGILSLKIIFLLLISAVLLIFSPAIMKIITPGFSSEKINETIMFSRIMFISTFFLGISALFGGILVSMKKFLIYAIAPILYNIGIIIGAVFFVKFMGPIGLAWGVVLGAFMHMLIQFPAVRISGFRYKPVFFKAFWNKNVMKVIHLMIPRTMGIAVNQINLFVITIFASTLAAGSLTVFNFANNIQGAPLGLFGASFAIAVFPTLSAFASKNMKDDFARSFSKTMRHILFFIIPISVFFLIFRAQIVRVILGAGKFDWEDTQNTFSILGILVLSLFAQGLIPLLTRSFYALHDTKTPFFVALIGEAINILLVIFLIDKFKVVGLAIAFAVATVVHMFILLTVLRSKFDSLDDKNIVISVFKISLASFAAGIVAQLFKYISVRFIPLDTFLGVFFQLALSGIIGIIIFILMSYLLKIKEFHYFKDSFRRKFLRFGEKIAEDNTEIGGV